LKERGFDAEGKRIRQDSESLKVSEGTNDNLVGSVEILVRPQCAQEDYTVVQADMDSLVDSLIRDRNKAGRVKPPQVEAVKVPDNESPEKTYYQ
jgi:hypothetical protein